MATLPRPARELQRHQKRAIHAYWSVEQITSKEEFDHYKIAVYAIGANILRSGLAGAMAVLERSSGEYRPDGRDNDKDGPRERATKALRRHLATANIPGVVTHGQDPGRDLPSVVRGLPLDDYILATREMLQVILWLRRAVQARGSV